MDMISKHLDIWTEAQVVMAKGGRGKKTSDQSHYGIKKLRELILELAVRGKLVEQDPNDEPASALLAKIAEEKARLLKEKKIKTQKKLPEIGEDEKPFELPKGWEWARLGNIGETNIGLTYSPKNVGDEGIPVLRAGNIQDRKIVYSDLIRVKTDVTERALVGEGDLLICARSGSRSLVGKAAIIPPLKEITAFGAFMAIFRSHINQYIHHFISSPVFRHAIDNVETTTINQITQGNLKSTVIPLPPLAEQHRIVAKVDELMALCDQLEQQQTASNSTLQTLRNTVLTSLTNTTNPTEFSETWQRIEANFDTLFNTEQSIDHLKQTILQLAVMGKLVPQNPKDEPASTLLEKIAQEKATLIKQGKIKKQKKLPDIGEDKKPFELPVGWEWIKFNSIIQELKYGTSKKSDYKTDGDPVLRIPNVVKGYIDSSDLKFTVLDEKEKQVLSLKKGDLLIIRSNGSVQIVGRSAIVDSAHVGFMYAGYLVRVRFATDLIHPNFLKLLLDAKLIRDQIELPIRTTSGVKNINSTEISSLLMPVVPLPEQHRIVTKVNELMLLCDTLKSHLKENQTTQVHLADTITQQAMER